MVQKSANRFVLGTKSTGTRSSERGQYGLSIEPQGINGLSTEDNGDKICASLNILNIDVSFSQHSTIYSSLVLSRYALYLWQIAHFARTGQTC